MCNKKTKILFFKPKRNFTLFFYLLLINFIILSTKILKYLFQLTKLLNVVKCPIFVQKTTKKINLFPSRFSRSRPPRQRIKRFNLINEITKKNLIINHQKPPKFTLIRKLFWFCLFEFYIC